MTIKVLGAICIILACGSIGFLQAFTFRQKENMLQQLVHAVQFMICELQYHQTPLPQLMRMSAAESNGTVGKILFAYGEELDRQLAPDAACCMNAVIAQIPKLPSILRERLLLLGRSMGRFDLTGQIAGLEAVCQLCKRDLDGMSVNRDVRLRSYLTLGLCAGIALVILFV